jgi:hypothetical protein
VKIERVNSNSRHPLHEIASVIILSEPVESFHVTELPVEFSHLSADKFKEELCIACSEFPGSAGWKYPEEYESIIQVDTIGSGRAVKGYTVTRLS